MAARQTATGIGTAVSLCHGTGCTWMDPGDPVNTVPLNSSSSGPAPSPTAWKYFAAATSKSYVQATGRSTVVSPANGGTRNVTCVQCTLRSVRPQPSGSPKRSASRRFVASS